MAKKTAHQKSNVGGCMLRVAVLQLKNDTIRKVKIYFYIYIYIYIYININILLRWESHKKELQHCNAQQTEMV